MTPEKLTPEEQKIQDAHDDALFKKVTLWAMVLSAFGAALYAFFISANISCLCFLIAAAAIGTQSLYIKPNLENEED